MKHRIANYRIVSEDDESLLIEDVGPWSVFPTITNSAEEVVNELVQDGRLRGRRLEYIDSEGQRDQLLVKDGRFAGFAPAGKTQTTP